MKSLARFILCVGMACILGACSNDQYTLERQYYKAQKQAEIIFKNPHVSPPNELQKIVAEFTDFVKLYPKTNLAIEANFVIVRLYLAKEEYESARTQLKKIIKDYEKIPSIASEAAFLIGYSYEIGGKWNLALEQYQKVLADYPTTRKSLELPIYIARYYKKKFQPDKMVAAYQEAINHYKMLSGKYPNSLLEFTTDTLTARCYLTVKKWNDAILVFKAMLEKYKDKKVKMDGTLLNIALIYAKELKDMPKAKETLETLVKDYPESKLIKIANKFLEEIDKNERDKNIRDK